MTIDNHHAINGPFSIAMFNYQPDGMSFGQPIIWLPSGDSGDGEISLDSWVIWRGFILVSQFLFRVNELTLPDLGCQPAPLGSAWVALCTQYTKDVSTTRKPSQIPAVLRTSTRLAHDISQHWANFHPLRYTSGCWLEPITNIVCSLGTIISIIILILILILLILIIIIISIIIISIIIISIIIISIIIIIMLLPKRWLKTQRRLKTSSHPQPPPQASRRSIVAEPPTSSLAQRTSKRVLRIGGLGSVKW